MAAFSEYAVSLAMRDTFAKIAENVIDKVRPKYRYGVVNTVDPLNSKATVTMTGDTSPVQVAYGVITPYVGANVRVNGIGTDKYIEDVLGGGVRTPASGTDLNTLTTDGVWQIDSSTLANTILNLPIPPFPASGANVGTVRASANGRLQVKVTPTRVIQTFEAVLNLGSPPGVRVFTYTRMRSSDGVTWGPWILQTPTISTYSESGQDTAGKALFARPESPVTIRRIDQVSTIPYTTFNGDTWTSDSGTPVSAPNWSPLTLDSGWTQYGGVYLQSAARRLSSGIVIVRGLIAATAVPAGARICVLPAGMRPAHKLMFIVAGSLGTGSIRIDVFANGDVVATGIAAAGSAVSFVSLSGIQFPCAEVAPASAWTNLTFSNSFYDYSPFDVTWPVAGYWVDSLGRYWFRGLVGRASAFAGDPLYAQLPAGSATNKQIHYAAMGIGGFSSQHAVTGGLYWKSGSSGYTWFSTPQQPILPVAAFPESQWINLSLVNSWVNYDPTSFPPGSILLAADGLVHVRGLIRTGSLATIANLGGGGVGATTAGQTIYAGNSNQAFARTDIAGTTLGANSGSNAWWSLDNIVYLRES